VESQEIQGRKAKGKRLAAVLVLLVVAFIWGATFTVVKEALQEAPVFVFLSQRFMLAFVAFIPLLLRSPRGLSRRVLRQGAVLGLLLYGAYAFQTLGLVSTTASNAAFITGLNVVLVPVLSLFLLGIRIEPQVLLGVLLAAFGLAGLCLGVDLRLNGGDCIIVLCAVCIALHIMYTGRFAGVSDVFWLAGVQLGVVGALSAASAWMQGQNPFVWIPGILWALVMCSLLASAFAFWAQTSMQRIISPAKTAVILCMEPVFGALYARVFGGELLGPWELAGGVFVFCGMLLAVIPFPVRAVTAASRRLLQLKAVLPD
jgi:drug/metabolite transporter (DMT)-like permease